MKAETMLIPTPGQVQEAIFKIPAGQTVTLSQLREELARASGADITCPFTAGVCWTLVAEASEKERIDGRTEVAPWWRVTRDGKPNPKLPGGEMRHRALLLEEGVRV